MLLIVVVDHFYIALVSALEKTRSQSLLCALKSQSLQIVVDRCC